MELARKCSEIISDVSDSDSFHPYIWISLSSSFILTIHIFSDVCSAARAHPRLKYKSTQSNRKAQPTPVP